LKWLGARARLEVVERGAKGFGLLERSCRQICMVIDVGSKQIWPGVEATANRMKEIVANCRNIAALWPTITPDD
jgi:hypothetical protein